MALTLALSPPSLFTFGDYDRQLIGGCPFITGRPNFWPETFAHLHPGMKVHKIGIPGKNGKPTSSSRIDTWSPYIVYRGTIHIGDFSSENAQKCLGFQLPPNGLTDINTGVSVDTPYFALYGIASNVELLKPNFNRGTIAIYKAVFTLEDGQILTDSQPTND